ncbi:MAG: LiaF domain-containing protein [Gemmatimonadota bacterium]
MTTPYQPPNDQGAASYPPPAPMQLIAPESMVPAARGVSAFLSSQVRGGDWILPRLFRAVAFWGEVTIDLTNARFGAGTSRIELMVIMGSVTILIPPDVRIECDGDAFIGSFELQGQKWSMPSENSPTIHVTGDAYIGSVEIKVINPNAPSWMQTLRNRWNEARGLGAGER